MKLRDLGTIKGDVMLFGGPYSNLEATQALFKVAQGRNIDAAHMVCTGDSVAYCADPCATVALLRDRGVATVAGNCEIQLAEEAVDCGCGFEKGSTCDVLARGWYSFANARLSAEDRAWMATCPDVIVFKQGGSRVAVIHGGISDVARFLWPTSTDAEFQAEIALLEQALGPLDAVVSGHSGLAFTRVIGRVVWINAGVIGMPPHDGRPETAYAVLSNGRFRSYRLSYDHKKASERMAQEGLLQGYEKALLSGYWPSEDILPEDLRVSHKSVVTPPL